MKNDMWSTIDFDSTIRDFEFTRKAMNEIHKVVYSGDFEDMDAAMIFTYLQSKMELVSFKDYLRRYIYSVAQITEPFYSVSDDVYREIIMSSFDDTFTPHSFEPTTKRWSAIVKGWLTSENVHRSTIFLLGFGFRMSETDVSEFLTKVIKEEDFNPALPREVIFHYCYRNHLSWSFASKKLKWYENVECPAVISEDIRKQILSKKMPVLDGEDALDEYLLGLKKVSSEPGGESASYTIFEGLIERAKQAVADIYNEDSEIGAGREWKSEEISSGDLEKMICCGIPMTSSGNLQKMSKSLLSKHFNQKRISRQRIDKLLQRKLNLERYDLITILFFIYTCEMAEEEPEIRCMKYMDEVNQLLEQCHFSALYPVNGYEAFVLMCLLSESPLPTYSEIWEMSYSQN